jgi:thiosulfate reductase cytochrome b subunit
MSSLPSPRSTKPVLFAIAITFGLTPFISAAAKTETPTGNTLSPKVVAEKNQACLDCHEQAGVKERIRFPSGETLGVRISAKIWLQSVHGRTVLCTGCHPGIEDHPHPALRTTTLLAYRSDQALSCKRCHYKHYTRVVDSIHYRELRRGNIKAPSCVNCHGAHGTRKADSPRLVFNKRCAQCHSEILQLYARSVHGKSLTTFGTIDVPRCTDCHGAHDIHDPRHQLDRLRVHQLCANCHGASNALYAKGAGTPKRPIATCVDCHGIDEIMPFSGHAESKAIKSRLLKRCQACHQGATPRFTDAWLFHLAIMTFVTLVLTGFPQSLQGAFSAGLIDWFGGLDKVRTIHRVAGIVFTAHALIHVLAIVIGVATKRMQLSLLAGPQDLRDAWHNLSFYLGAQAEPPHFPKFDYRQKFEYLGMVLGGMVMVCTGLILFFPVQAASILPGQFIPAARVAHSNEALLALLVLMIWHVYSSHLSPEIFPADQTIFTGTISKEELRERHRLEHDRIFGSEEKSGGAAESTESVGPNTGQRKQESDPD